ncbi:LutB/LldF family L-lactate oxidation iron-sulfur protein [Pseudoclavibacter sp. CFCC 13611]|uniref:LutB/LldF family L-lactate oxidation iron-sulfur protein n=1 Tax=Pseudoclavibacter sp. CFCC 13611 TaxID=2615178 RepID=UPI001300F7AD|nr:LutB/LldF family L-lactate oxidation iron-sulfur protein [Pseudoclavibacter sp. CFCC 13611]KAB1663682.1 iron-sulfur cluster-binding protein [Pseudoclavibacter sp. CFCC 13611]KAB1664569.1 iron-sulfur cluster-binding protein [Pseudoclavibacter sp. CFCC 13611]
MTTFLGMPAVPPVAPAGVGNLRGTEKFQQAAVHELANEQLRRNLNFATHKIRDKRQHVVDEMPDWQRLREAGSRIKREVLANLPDLLEQLEEKVTEHGGQVHWARDAAEANEIVRGIVADHGAKEVLKIKSMATQEIGLNEYLEEHGIHAQETDLAELIVQLGHDKPSHILVPAIHRNRSEVRDIFLKEMPGVDPDLDDNPAHLAEASRRFLREKFLTSKIAISGANFGIAETGTLSIFESEGNGRMNLTLPDTLVTVMGIEKLLPRFNDLEVFTQLLPRSSTGERMNPYTSLWTGVTPGDGPQEFHLVLLDNGRTHALADDMGREALKCIRCSACLNVCPVYEHAGGHAYGSTYPGPIGAILSPLLTGMEDSHDPNSSLPYASSLCGACYEVCPVKIDIPSILVELRDQKVNTVGSGLEKPMLKTVASAMSSGKRWHAAQKAASIGGRIVAGPDKKITKLPGLLGGWTDARDFPAPAKHSAREWFKTADAKRELAAEQARSNAVQADLTQRPGNQDAQRDADWERRPMPAGFPSPAASSEQSEERSSTQGSTK